MAKGKGSGWHGEKRRHSMARKGVSTSPGYRYGKMLASGFLEDRFIRESESFLERHLVDRFGENVSIDSTEIVVEEDGMGVWLRSIGTTDSGKDFVVEFVYDIMHNYYDPDDIKFIEGKEYLSED